MALRIAFFGQAAFGRDVLVRLLEAGHEVAAVYAPPDAGRPDPLAQEAQTRGLACLRQVCSDGSEHTPCTVDADCTVRACVNGVCSAGGDGARCEADDDCASQRCAKPAGAEPGACTSGAPGARCAFGPNCVSGTCGFDGTCE